jgi:hypothetical protein
MLEASTNMLGNAKAVKVNTTKAIEPAIVNVCSTITRNGAKKTTPVTNGRLKEGNVKVRLMDGMISPMSSGNGTAKTAVASGAAAVVARSQNITTNIMLITSIH